MSVLGWWYSERLNYTTLWPSVTLISVVELQCHIEYDRDSTLSFSSWAIIPGTAQKALSSVSVPYASRASISIIMTLYSSHFSVHFVPSNRLKAFDCEGWIRI